MTDARAALRRFLDDRRTTSSTWTITGMGGSDMGSYGVEAADYDTFLSLVNNHIFGRPPRASTLLEKHKENGPILVDLDFRYEKTDGPLLRRFTHDHIQTFIAMYVAALIYFTRVEDLPDDLVFYDMVKPSPELDKSNQKDGIHIQCPTLTTSPKFQYAIRGFLLSQDIIGHIFGETSLSNPAEDVYDVRVIHTNNWFLYGACKPNKPQYKVERMWKISISDVVDALDGQDPGDFGELVDIVQTTMTDMVIPKNTLELMKTLSIRHGHDTQNEPALRECRTAEWDELVNQWGAGKAKSRSALGMPSLPPRLPAEGAGGDAESVAETLPLTQTQTASHEDDVKLAYRICKECLNAERRAGDYHDWIRLAICLKNIADNDESFEAWVDVTRRVDPSHSKATKSIPELRAKWNLVRIGGATRPIKIASLIKWAEEDNFETLHSIRSETITEWIVNYANDTHVSIATLVYRVYKYDFMCSVGAGRSKSYDLYQYLGHSWRKLRTSNELRQRLSNEVKSEIILANGKAGERQVNAGANEAERKMWEERRKKLYLIERQLEMTTFKDHALKESQEKFYNEEFSSKLDCDPFLVGVSNGVLVLNHFDDDAMTGRPHVMFRKGLPDDCISFQMGRMEPDMDPIPYVPYNASDPDQIALMNFFSLIYPDPVLKEYVLTLLASCLEGQNKEQRFYVNQGGGSNGKSMIQNLMEFTFGDYQTSLQTTVLTRKRPESGAANPDMITTKCKRYIYMGEPDNGEKLNTSRMKQLSGEDRIEARGLFSDQEKFNMMGKLFLSCNDLPPVSSMDNGTWRRIRVIPHVSTFKDPGSSEIDPTKNIYEKDLSLKTKLKYWRVAFLSLLVHYYDKKYLVHGLKEPECVMAASNRYKEKNDMFMLFFNENYEKKGDALPILAKDVKIRFRDWRKRLGRDLDLKEGQMLERMRAECGNNSTDKEFYGIAEIKDDEPVDLSGAHLAQ
jgi:P4 family phage/plasmid primase-like protien